MSDSGRHTAIMLPPGRGETLWFFEGLLTFKATADQTGGTFVVAEQLFRAGMATPLHVAHDDYSSWYVVEGRLTFHVGDSSCDRVTAGSFIHIPPGVPYAFSVESETARLLRVTTPQHERFFRAAGVPAPAATLPPPDDPRGQVDPEKFGAAAERFGLEIVGPAPSVPRAEPGR